MKLEIILHHTQAEWVELTTLLYAFQGFLKEKVEYSKLELISVRKIE